VRVAGQHAGAAISCQFAVRPPDDEPAPWQADLPGLAAELGVPPDRLAAVLASVRTVPASSLERISRLNAAAARAYSNIGEERLGLVSRLRRIAEITNLAQTE
jgi:hypothetical protein